MRTRLTDDEITRELASLPGWERRGDAIARTFTFTRFADGIAFVDRVAVAADAADHHPDIDIRYTRVTCALSTHDAGGITRADVRLAREIDQLAGG
ncbi:MAG TPA: 4a-hydroxytetrahydrobiopterin dehydratase [Gemmatimonadaceae bacterium]|jgi:4a-hydroxytetrahydrobiopterin dehydratase